jgi:hypothetical protein
MAITRLVRVVTEKEVRVTFPDGFFKNDVDTEEKYIAVFNKEMWPIDSMDDVADYAARMAAEDGGRGTYDALGKIGPEWDKPDVIVSIGMEDSETEIIG